MTVAAILGDAVNYAIGKRIPRQRQQTSRLLNKDHLLKAQRFYEKYGGKTIILARFIPIIRTFAPFVAWRRPHGYGRFALYNVVGGVVWVWSFLRPATGSATARGQGPVPLRHPRDHRDLVAARRVGVPGRPAARKHGGSERASCDNWRLAPVDSPSVD